MRLGLIGDVHAESSLLRTVLQAFDKVGVKRTHHPCFVLADLQNQSATRFDIQKDGTFEPGEAWNLGQAPG